jgi:hypothetical protein
MTTHELCVALQSLEPENEVFVALYVEDTAELFGLAAAAVRKPTVRTRGASGEP